MADWGGKVAAWFGAVVAASAGLAALIAAVAKPPLHGLMHGLFITLVVVAAVSFTALLLTGPPAVYGAWRNRRVVKVHDLASRAEVLSGELFTFTADRDQDDPVRQHRFRSAGVSDEQWPREWHEHTTRIMEYSAETRSRYDMRFRVRALAIFNDAVQAGLEQEEDRQTVENPTNMIGIREVAQMMGMIAHAARRSGSKPS